jgi:hypothetical protein
MNKIEFIKKIETDNLIFSVLKNSSLIDNPEKLDKNPNLKLIFTESDFSNNKIVYNSKLFSSSRGFYVFLKRLTLDEGISKYELTIYHLPEQINEIIIFLKFINK